MAGYDVLGNIMLLKFKRGVKISKKKKFALNFLKNNKNIRTVLEKVEKFKGRLRTQKSKWLAGEKTKEALYKENNCFFRFNVDTCYFSPRLASERKEVGEMVNKGEKVLVMFGGVGPFAIVIGKMGKALKVVSVDLGRACNKYALENVKRNKLNNVEITGGDVRKVIGSGKKINEKFDRIVMARPNLKDSFLDVAFSIIKKGGFIHYHGFYFEKEVWKLEELIKDESKKASRQVRILRIKKAGEIGSRKFRFRADIKVLN